MTDGVVVTVILSNATILFAKYTYSSACFVA